MSASTERNPRPLAYGPAQAAKALGISRGKYYQLLREGRLPSFTLGRRRLTRVCDLEDFLARAVEETVAQANAEGDA
jgi:excisionase family DNA binding protein